MLPCCINSLPHFVLWTITNLSVQNPSDVYNISDSECTPTLIVYMPGTENVHINSHCGSQSQTSCTQGEKGTQCHSLPTPSHTYIHTLHISPWLRINSRPQLLTDVAYCIHACQLSSGKDMGSSSHLSCTTSHKERLLVYIVTDRCHYLIFPRQLPPAKQSDMDYAQIYTEAMCGMHHSITACTIPHTSTPQSHTSCYEAHQHTYRLNPFPLCTVHTLSLPSPSFPTSESLSHSLLYTRLHTHTLNVPGSTFSPPPHAGFWLEIGQLFNKPFNSSPSLIPHLSTCTSPP